MGKLRIGTRESQLAVWQATAVKKRLKKAGIESELVYIKSEGDLDLVTPLYDLGVQGIFTRALDSALLNNTIDLAVHSMKDVPVQLAKGIQQAAVLKRGSYKDVLVLHPDLPVKETQFAVSNLASTTAGPGKVSREQNRDLRLWDNPRGNVVIATSSIRRKAQWLNQYPAHKIENLRGNVNTRLQKLKQSDWHGAIFAAAGLERLGLLPEDAIDLDWMLPAPAQGAIMVVCRADDEFAFESCESLNHEATALCTKIEREFLAALMGGCSTPISGLAKIRNDQIIFKGNIASPDGRKLIDTEVRMPLADSAKIALQAASSILSRGGTAIMQQMRKKGFAGNDEH